MADPGENTFNVEGVIQSSFVSLTLLNTAESRMKAAQEEKDTYQAEFEALSADQNEKLRQITELNKEINSFSRLLTDNRDSLETLEREKDKNEKRRDEIQKILDLAEEGDERIPVLEKELEDLENRHSALKDLISDTKSSIKEIESEISDKTQLREDLTAVSNELAGQIRETGNKLAAAETTLIEATQLYNGYYETYSFQQSQIVSITSVVDDPVNNLVNSIVNKGVSLDSQIEAKNNKISELESKRGELGDKRNSCEEKQLDSDIASSLTETFEVWEVRFNNELKAFIKLIELKIRGYRAQHEGNIPSENKKNEIRETYGSYGAELRAAWEEYQEALDRHAFMLNQLETLPLSIETTKREIEKLTNLIAGYKDLLKEKTKDKKILEAQIPSLEDQKSANEQIIRDATKFLEKVGRDIEKMGKELQVEEAGLVEDNGEKSKTEADIATLTTQISTLESAIATLETEIEAIVTSISDKKDEDDDLQTRIQALIIKRDEGGGLTEAEATELATKEASVEQIKQDIEALEKSREQKTDQKKTFQTDLDKAKDDKSSADKELAEINDNISAREAAIAKIKDQIQNANSDAAAETKKKNDAESENKTIDKQITEAKSKLQLLEAEVESLEQKLVDSEEEKADNESELASEEDELKELTADDNQVIKDAKKDMESKLGDYNTRKDTIANEEKDRTTKSLEKEVKGKVELIELTNTLLTEANNMAKALIQFEDAQAFTSQVGSAINSMVNGSNDEENIAVDKQRQASDDLENPDGTKVNFSARDANTETGADKFAMTVTGPLIKEQIERNPTVKFVMVPIELDVAPEEIDTLIRLGYGISFNEKQLRKGDTFSNALQMKISWEVDLNAGKS